MAESVTTEKPKATIWVEIIRPSGSLKARTKMPVDPATAARWVRKAKIAKLISPPDLENDPTVKQPEGDLDPLTVFSDDELRSMLEYNGVSTKGKKRPELMQAMRKLSGVDEPTAVPKSES